MNHDIYTCQHVCTCTCSYTIGKYASRTPPPFLSNIPKKCQLFYALIVFCCYSISFALICRRPLDSTTYKSKSDGQRCQPTLKVCWKEERKILLMVIMGLALWSLAQHLIHHGDLVATTESNKSTTGTKLFGSVSFEYHVQCEQTLYKYR